MNGWHSRPLVCVSRHEYKALAERRHTGRRSRVASRWPHCAAPIVAQQSGRNNQRNIGDKRLTRARCRRHLGNTKRAGVALARINAEKSRAFPGWERSEFP